MKKKEIYYVKCRGCTRHLGISPNPDVVILCEICEDRLEDFTEFIENWGDKMHKIIGLLLIMPLSIVVLTGIFLEIINNPIKALLIGIVIMFITGMYFLVSWIFRRLDMGAYVNTEGIFTSNCKEMTLTWLTPNVSNHPSIQHF